MNCGDCHKPASALYQRSTDYKWVGFECLPPQDIDRYPGWRERHERQEQRAAQARKNFAK